MGESLRAARQWIVLLPVAVLLVGTGCSDSTDSGASYPVSGRVRDPQGNPVGSARVAIEYRLVDAGMRAQSADVKAPRPETCMGFDLPQESHVNLWLIDYRRRMVRTILDEILPAGSHEFCWDGTADDGAAQPDGVYYFHLEWGDVSATKAILLSSFCLGMARTDAYLVFTDSDGRYAVDWRIVPVGESVPEIDSSGAVIRDRLVSDSVRVCAWKDEMAGSEPAEIKQGHSATVDLIIQ